MKDSDLERYSRHILLPQVDVEGQQAICAAHVAIIGLGGLGSPVAMYLAAAGVGRFTLIDDDAVELSNLQRQIIHTQADIGVAKVESAARSLSELNPDVMVTPLNGRADELYLNDNLHSVTAVIDCTDNASTRYVINRWCLDHGVPWVSGAAIGFSGQVMVFDPSRPETPCYACLHPVLPEISQSCAESGVLSPLVGMVGSVQAIEALRLIVGFGGAQAGKMTLWDGLRGDCHSLSLPKLNDCPECNGAVETVR